MAVRVKIWKRGPVVIDRVFAPYTEGEPLPAGDPCANCGDRTPGHFCRHCGQARRVVHVSLREMVADFLEDQLTINAKLPRTLLFLLLRPGYLTREYLRGRIASYVRPLKLYVGTSVVFFLAFAFAARAAGWSIGPELGLDGGEPPVARATAAEAPARAPLDPAGSAAAREGEVREAVARPVPPPPPVAAAKTFRFNGLGAFGDTLEAKAARFGAMSRPERQRVVQGAMQDELPKMMFVMLPLFALLLKVLYLGRRHFYVEHFIFALHFHAFVFLLLTLLVAAEQVPELHGSGMEGIAGGWIFLYLFVAMKKVYGQGILTTGAKYVMLLGSYFFALVLGFLATVLAFVYFL